MTPLDQLARDRITKDGLDETLFVGAGAGTGKTSTLVDRIIHLVVDQQVSLSNLAAITFTEAAASELRDRVRRALEVCGESTDPFVAERCRDALVEFDSAAISTLHGFALRLLKEHPIEVAIPPRLAVLDPVQSALASEQRWNEQVTRWLFDPSFASLVVRLWSVNIELRRANGPSLRDMAAILDDNWDRIENVQRRTNQTLGRLDRTALHSAIRDVLALLPECRDPSDTMHVHIQTLLPLFQAILDCDPADDDRFLQLIGTDRRWSKRNGGSKKRWPDVAAIRDAVTAADEAANAVRVAATDEILKIWLDIVSEVTIEAARQRRDSAELEFHDLLVLARRLMRTSEAARRAAHQRYTRLLLDEFQDTDPIQIELALRIAAAPADQPDDWHDLQPLPGRLFVVGDPKQSIYRFRRADIALYLRTGESFGDHAAVALTQNFRTVEPIVAWVNQLFDHLMPAQTLSQPRYVPLHAARSASPAGDHRVVLFGPAHPDNPKATELRHREAADVAALIDGIRRDPESRMVWTEDLPTDLAADVTAEASAQIGGAAVTRPAGDTTVTSGWRPARCGDICILLPARTSLPMLEAALGNRDIPYRLDTSTLVFDSPEIHDLLNVLLAIDDPADALSIVGALRSPILACSDAHLLSWRNSGGTWDYRVQAPESAPREMVEAMAAMARWHEAAQWSEPATMLERVVREREVLALGLANRRPRDAWRRVRFLIDQARQFADQNGGHLREFVGWVEMQRNEGSRVPEPLLPETDDDAVRIMTLHGAKGLEFPIVFLSGMTSQPGNSRSGPKIHWGPGDVPEVGFGSEKSTSYFDVLNDFESEMDLDEKIRLLYVGATRARDHLFVSTHRTAKDDSAAKTYGARIHRASSDHAPGSWVDAESLPNSAKPPPSEHRGAERGHRVPDDEASVDLDEWGQRRDALLATARGSRRVWSPTAIASALHAPGVPNPGGPASERDTTRADASSTGTAAAAGSAVNSVDLGDALEREGDRPPAHRGGTAFGRAVHAVAQFAPVAASSASSDASAAWATSASAMVHLGALAERAVIEESLPPAAASDVEAAARHLLALPTVGRALASARHWREVPVCAPGEGATTRANPAGGPYPLVEGFVDLLAEIDGELVVIDYKTDFVTPASIADHAGRYAEQLGAYAVAIEAATGRRVARAVLAFCSPVGATEFEIEDLPAATRRVREFLANGG